MAVTALVQEKLARLPDRPGVYVYRDESGKVLYVGKAVNLKNRVRSYFVEGGGHSPRIQIMVPRVHDIETIVTDSEIEALILESNLIKKHRPHYNVRLRDDKQYPYICLTMNEPFPRPIIVRRVKRDGNRYFGPYTSSWAMRQALRVIRQVFQLRGCGRTITTAPPVRSACWRISSSAFSIVESRNVVARRSSTSRVLRWRSAIDAASCS